MTFEPRYEKITSSFKVDLGKTQTAVECKLPISEGRVTKVLSANAKAFVQSSELVGDIINYNGFASFQVIYLNEDGLVECLDYTAEFKDKISLKEAFNGVVYLFATVVNLDCEIVDDGVRSNAIIELQISGVGSTTANMLSTVNNDSCYIKNELVKYTTFKGVASDKFELTQDFQIKDSVEKILSVCPNAYLESVVANEKFITVKGSVCVNICYLSSGDNALPRNYESSFDFVQEVAMENVLPNDFVDSILNIMINDVKVTTSIDVELCSVALILPMKFDGYVFENSEVDGVTDIYCTTNYLSTEYSTISNINSHSSKDFVSKINGSLLIEDNAPFVDEVLGVTCSNLVIAKNYIEDDNLIVEGVGECTVIYYTKELNSLTSHVVQMPFSETFKVDEFPNYEHLQTEIYGTLCDINAKSKRGKEITIDGNLYFYVEFSGNDNQTFISNVGAGDEKPNDEYAIHVYLVKQNETVWDIAKQMGVSPELIMEQNPNMELPLKAGDKIFIYKQKLVEF